MQVAISHKLTANLSSTKSCSFVEIKRLKQYNNGYK